MERQVAWAAGKPGEEDILLAAQSYTEAYYGLLRKSRDSSRQAVESAQRAEAEGTAATRLATAAVREAELGNWWQARQSAEAALAMASGRDVKVLAALALARAGARARAQEVASELARSNLSNTLLNFYWLPTIRAALEFDRNNPGGAVDLLKTATAYELGAGWPLAEGTLYPVYLRAQAYLLGHHGQEAVREFQRYLDYRSITLSFPLGALAHLGLARA